MKMFFVSRSLGRMLKKLNKNVSSIPRVIYKHNVQPLSSSQRFFSTVADEQSDLKFIEIAKGDKELEHKLNVLALELEMMRQEGHKVPDNEYLKPENWNELLKLSGRHARQKYLLYLFKISKKEENKKQKSEERRIRYEEYLARREQEKQNKPNETIEEFSSKYDLQHNTIFLRFYETTINQLYNNRLIQAMKFGQKLVVDLGYDNEMTKRENLYAAKQLMLLFAENRAHDDPFDLHFCNANPNSCLMEQLHKFIPTLTEPWFPLNVHESSYLDLFKKEDLIYLTPHCREEIREFDHNATYIIGGIVDKSNQAPLSMAKAKKEGIKMAKLPLDRYLQWSTGSGKSLTLNQVASILLDQKVSSDWNYSLQHVPRRKIVTEKNTFQTNDNSNLKKIVQYQRKRWIPAHNVDFNSLSFNSSNQKNKKDKYSRKIQSIFDE